jgi:urease accessory protein
MTRVRRIDRILGNVHTDVVWRECLDRAAATGVLETLTLTRWDAQKRRLRASTSAGTDLGIALTDTATLCDGAVLAYDPPSGRMIVVRVASPRLLVLTVDGDRCDDVAERAVRLGHVLGNQHWPARVSGRRTEVPLAIDERVVRTVLETYNLAGVRYEFVDAPTLPVPNLRTDPTHHG